MCLHFFCEIQRQERNAVLPLGVQFDSNELPSSKPAVPRGFQEQQFGKNPADD
jgi:hypothetical protein